MARSAVHAIAVQGAPKRTFIIPGLEIAAKDAARNAA